MPESSERVNSAEIERLLDQMDSAVEDVDTMQTHIHHRHKRSFDDDSSFYIGLGLLFGLVGLILIIFLCIYCCQKCGTTAHQKTHAEWVRKMAKYDLKHSKYVKVEHY